MSVSVPARKNAPMWEDARARQKPRWDTLGQFLENRLQRADSDGGPKYKILQDALSDAIRSGVVGENELLPTENDLVVITPFSLGTVQRALKHLVATGLIARKAGVGTIVMPWRRELENPLHTKFIDAKGDVMPVYTEVVSRRRVSGAGPWEDFLNSGINTLVIKRRTVIGRDKEEGGDFSYYSHFYIDGSKYSLFKNTPKRELHGLNFKRKLAQDFNLVLTQVSNHLSVVNATTEIAAALKIDVGTALIQQRIYVHSSDGPLYYQEYWLPPNAQEVVIDTALDNFSEI